MSKNYDIYLNLLKLRMKYCRLFFRTPCIHVQYWACWNVMRHCQVANCTDKHSSSRRSETSDLEWAWWWPTAAVDAENQRRGRSVVANWNANFTCCVNAFLQSGWSETNAFDSTSLRGWPFQYGTVGCLHANSQFPVFILFSSLLPQPDFWATVSSAVFWGVFIPSFQHSLFTAGKRLLAWKCNFGIIFLCNTLTRVVKCFLTFPFKKVTMNQNACVWRPRAATGSPWGAISLQSYRIFCVTTYSDFCTFKSLCTENWNKQMSNIVALVTPEWHKLREQ